MFKDTITLFQLGTEQTRTGGRKRTVTSEREVFADKTSVGMREFYQAHQAGFETTAVFIIYTEEYEEERVIMHNGKYFTVVRTYEKGDFIHLTATKRSGLFEETRS